MFTPAVPGLRALQSEEVCSELQETRVAWSLSNRISEQTPQEARQTGAARVLLWMRLVVQEVSVAGVVVMAKVCLVELPPPVICAILEPLALSWVA